MNTTKDPNKSGFQNIRAWSILVSVDKLEQPTSEGQYTNFEQAVASLKSVRLDMYNDWVTPAGPETRDTYPYRNKIAELWQLEPLDFPPDKVGWGYRWYDQAQNSVVRVWMEKTSIWSREAGETIDAPGPTKEEIRKMYRVCEIDYVAFGQAAPDNAWFDEETREFMFQGEGDGDIEDDCRVEDNLGEEDLDGDRSEEDGLEEEDLELCGLEMGGLEMGDLEMAGLEGDLHNEDGFGGYGRDEDDRDEYIQEDYDGEYELRKSN